MTKPTPKDIKAIADPRGVRRFRAGVRNLAVRSRPGDFPAGADREGVVMSAEPALMSLTAVAKAIADKQVSSQEATKSCLHRIAQWQPRLNAFMSIEAEAALKAAGEADAELAKGKSRGPLRGVPLAHTHMYYEAGHVAPCGSHIRRDFVPTTTSTALRRLRDAGSIRLG